MGNDPDRLRGVGSRDERGDAGEPARLIPVTYDRKYHKTWSNALKY